MLLRACWRSSLPSVSIRMTSLMVRRPERELVPLSTQSLLRTHLELLDLAVV